MKAVSTVRKFLIASRNIGFCTAGFLASGCAAITSTQQSTGSVVEGLPYYLPKRPILISVAVDKATSNPTAVVDKTASTATAATNKTTSNPTATVDKTGSTATVAANKTTSNPTAAVDKTASTATVAADKTAGNPTVTVSEGAMEPDLTHRFTIKYNENYAGTNAINVVVNSRGLLQSSNSSITSSTGQIATSLGTLLGAAAGLGAAEGGNNPPPCVSGQTYSYVYHPAAGGGPQTLACGVTLTVIPGATIPATPDTTSVLPGDGKSKDGIFFRQEIAYTVQAQDKNGQLLGLWQAYSPDQSDTFFYPVSKTVFANSHTNFVFSDGVLTTVDQTSDSEINGVLQIPANIISGYTTALGQVFSAFSTSETDKKTSELNSAKLQYCKAVVAANPLAGKTGTDLTTAEANIAAACQ